MSAREPRRLPFHFHRDHSFQGNPWSSPPNPSRGAGAGPDRESRRGSRWGAPAGALVDCCTHDRLILQHATSRNGESLVFYLCLRCNLKSRMLPSAQAARADFGRQAQAQLRATLPAAVFEALAQRVAQLLAPCPTCPHRQHLAPKELPDRLPNLRDVEECMAARWRPRQWTRRAKPAREDGPGTGGHPAGGGSTRERRPGRRPGGGGHDDAQ